MSEGQLKMKQENTKTMELTDPIMTDNSKVEEAQLPTSSDTDTSDDADTDIVGSKTENSEKFEKEVARIIAQKFSGPIPPPSIIAGYEDVVPGAADRIIKMAEQQSQHRQNIELMETKAEIRDSLLGVIFAFGLGVGCLAACVVTVIMVPQGAGAVCGSLLGVTGIGSIVAAFLKNTRRSSK